MKSFKIALTWLVFTTALLSGVCASAAENTIADIKARGVLTVGTEAAYPPYEFIKDDKIVGYGRDILEYMADKLGVKLEQRNLPLQGLLPGLLAHKFDFVATSLGITEQRAKHIAYTRPIGAVVSEVVVKKGNTTIKRLEDIEGKNLGTQMGSLAQPAIEEYNKQLQENGGEGYAKLRLYQSYPDVAAALSNGTIDAGVMPSNIMALYKKQKPDAYRIVGPVGGHELLCWAVNPQDKEILHFINSTLDEMKDNGTLEQLQKKWFGETLDLPTDTKEYLPSDAIQLQ